METMELQTNIIRLILDIEDNELLTYLNNLLEKHKNEHDSFYKISEIEKLILQESIEQYNNGNIIENDEILKRNQKWLKE